MNIEEFIDYVHSNPETVLGIPGKPFDYIHGKGTVCPICKSGTNGHKNTGPTSKDGGVHFRCWAGCYGSADVIDIIGIEYKLTEFMDKIKKTADIYGVDIDLEDSDGKNQKEYKKAQNKEAPDAKEPEEPEPEPEPDYTEFFKEAASHIEETNYHRGLPVEVLKEYGIGYVKDWKSPTAIKNGYNPASSSRLIIPTSAHSYTARATDDSDPARYKKEGKTHIFNLKALYDNTPESYVIVVEGEINALSVIAAGGNALALGSTAMEEKFIEEYKKIKKEYGDFTKKLVLAFDNDNAGQQAQDKLARDLEGLNLKEGKDFFIDPGLYEHSIGGTYNDANEAYRGNIERFKGAVSYAMDIEKNQYIQRLSDKNYTKRFLKEVRDYSGNECYPTGFSKLDNTLDGGLHPGLYTIGAISSLGKTTFCLQIADYIARAGTDVMFFSLEMAKKELLAKRVSRLTYTKAVSDNGSSTMAKSTNKIITSKYYNEYSKEELNLIEAARLDYEKHIAPNMFTIEGSIKEVKGQPQRTGMQEIRAAVKRHIDITRNKPVVFIDYLQMIGPEDIRATDKQNVDATILRLKQLSRDFNIPVVVISSFNRDNYTEPVSYASFKESGSIEYSSDVLIGLQYNKMEYEENEKKENHTARVRALASEEEERGKQGLNQHIQWKVIKNRNGTRGAGTLDFYPGFNYFTEVEEAPEKWIGLTDDDIPL